MLSYLIDDKFIENGDRIALGVSGGADSMLLLSSVICKSKTRDFYFKVICVNHHIRGEESDRDAKFVADFCKKLKVEYEIVDINVPELKQVKKLTLEEAARIARYDAINGIMKRDNLNKLFLAHHSNDQAETILMNIFRGSGILGATGIRNSCNIIRPLLSLTKKEILKLCEDNKIPFVTDSTNLQNDSTRNFIRNVIIPKIEEIYPDATSKIASFGERCAEVQNFIESFVDEKLISEEKGNVFILGGAFENKSPVVREYIKRVFERLGIFADIEAKHYKLVMELWDLPVNSSIDLPHKITAKKVHNGVKFSKKSVKKEEFVEYPFALGETEIEGYGKIVTEIISEYDVNYGDGCFYIDYYKISNEAVWRFRKLGDEFAKLGTGSKKLNDYFTDKKIDVDKRDRIPVLANGNRIYLVAGLDVGENVKISGPTDKIAKITFYEN